MAERASHQPEHHKPRQRAEHAPKRQEQHRPRHEHERKHEKKEQAPVHELQHEAKKEALPAAESVRVEQESPQTPNHYISKTLKKQTLYRTLKNIRKQLSAPERALSRVIHQPAVDAVSQFGSKTIARPSGLLGGSTVAFLGSSAYLWMAKHYGFYYNYFLFVLLFIGGFALGMTIELIIFAIRKAARRT